MGLAAGADHTCALVGDGEVWCWGMGDHGQLGLAHTDAIGDDDPPSRVDVGARAVSLTAGGLHTCALVEGGEAICWGSNDRGSSAMDDHKRSETTNRHPRPAPFRSKWFLLTAVVAMAAAGAVGWLIGATQGG